MLISVKFEGCVWDPLSLNIQYGNMECYTFDAFLVYARQIYISCAFSLRCDGNVYNFLQVICVNYKCMYLHLHVKWCYCGWINQFALHVDTICAESSVMFRCIIAISDKDETSLSRTFSKNIVNIINTYKYWKYCTHIG